LCQYYVLWMCFVEETKRRIAIRGGVDLSAS
jgi:hypothetical protein